MFSHYKQIKCQDEEVQQNVQKGPVKFVLQTVDVEKQDLIKENPTDADVHLVNQDVHLANQDVHLINADVNLVDHLVVEKLDQTKENLTDAEEDLIVEVKKVVNFSKQEN